MKLAGVQFGKNYVLVHQGKPIQGDHIRLTVVMTGLLQAVLEAKGGLPGDDCLVGDVFRIGWCANKTGEGKGETQVDNIHVFTGETDVEANKSAGLARIMAEQGEPLELIDLVAGIGERFTAFA